MSDRTPTREVPRTDLHPKHQPRAWRCSPIGALFCTHHGDCTCGRALANGEPVLAKVHECPLHGLNPTADEHRRGVTKQV